MSTDPYGVDVLLTDNGDLAVNAAGQLQLLSGPLVCAQQMVMRLRTFPGELPLDLDYGNPIDTVIGTKTGDPQLVVSKVNVELRQILEDDARFLRAQNIVAGYPDPADPTKTAVSLQLVLTGGDTLDLGDLAAGDVSLADFTATPDLATELGDDTLPDFTGDPGDPDDVLPDLDDELIDDGLAPGGVFETGTL